MPLKSAALSCSNRFYSAWRLTRIAGLAIFLLGSIGAFPASAAPPRPQRPDGQRLYNQYCAKCHSSSHAIRAPQLNALRSMRPQDVLDTLDFGPMKFVGIMRTAPEQVALAEFVTGKKLQAEGPDEESKAGRCPDGMGNFNPASPEWNGWGNGLTNARFQNADQAGLKPDQIANLKVRWAFGFPANTTLSQPTVVGGRVFVGSSRARVYSIDAKTGCLFWSAKAPAGVRTAMTVAALPGTSPARYAVYFGDLAANAHAVDAQTGAPIWSTLIDSHPMARITGAPVLYDGRLYVPVSSTEEAAGADASYACCTFRGSVAALDAATGKLIWQAYTIRSKPRPIRKNRGGVQLWGPSGAGVWSAPTIDAKRGRLYVTTGDNYSDPATKTSDAILAFDLKSGAMLWSRQFTARDAFTIGCAVNDPTTCPKANGPDLDFGSSAILHTLPNGKRVLVAGQKSGVLHAIDPDRNGKVLWERRVGHGGVLGGIEWGEAADDDNVYVALSDVGLKIKQQPGLGPVTDLDPSQGGGMFAYDLATGEQRWKTPPVGCGARLHCSPAQSAAVSAIPGIAFSGSVDGHMRAYSTQEGKTVWDFDAVKGFKTVNRVKAQGGSFDSPGATIADGMLFAGSGYGLWGGEPGNVLLGFSLDGQ
ncbi:MAG TPA: PQQ-binding-like beta-propeller repeat protein [Candidatus Binataceae bacterium]|nr:PQQ-binding-like beta-propeller repeat protein [Candidatus Binataceae bacterium]